MMLRTTILILAAAAGGCSVKSSLLPGSVPSDSEREPTAGSAPSTREAEESRAPAAGLPDLDARFVRRVEKTRAECPLRPEPPDRGRDFCAGRQRRDLDLYERVENQAHPQVASAKAYLEDLGESIGDWEAAEAKSKARQRVARDRSDRIYKVRRRAEALIRHLQAARTGEVAGTLTTFENRDAAFVEHKLGMLADQMEALASLEDACDGPTSGDEDLCALVSRRDALYDEFLSLQFDAILRQELQTRRNVVDAIESEGRVIAVNYDKMSKLDRLRADLGRDLGRIAEALGQENVAPRIDRRVEKLHADFAAAIRARRESDAWQEHAAARARFKDGKVARVARSMRGLRVVRVRARDRDWKLVRDHRGRPRLRAKRGMALMRRPGESFCRLYSLTVVQDHLGGGRYGEPHLADNYTPEFYISRCP